MKMVEVCTIISKATLPSKPPAKKDPQQYSSK